MHTKPLGVYLVHPASSSWFVNNLHSPHRGRVIDLWGHLSIGPASQTQLRWRRGEEDTGHGHLQQEAHAPGGGRTGSAVRAAWSYKKVTFPRHHGQKHRQLGRQVHAPKFNVKKHVST